MKLISMTRLVLETHTLTTIEFCSKYEIPRPSDFSGECKIKEIKLKGFTDYAKFLSKEITVEVLIKELGFVFLDSKDKSIEFINNGYCIVNTKHDFWLSSYDATEGREIKTVEDLVGLDINVNFKFN